MSFCGNPRMFLILAHLEKYASNKTSSPHNWRLNIKLLNKIPPWKTAVAVATFISINWRPLKPVASSCQQIMALSYGCLSRTGMYNQKPEKSWGDISYLSLNWFFRMETLCRKSMKSSGFHFSTAGSGSAFSEPERRKVPHPPNPDSTTQVLKGWLLYIYIPWICLHVDASFLFRKM